MMSASQLMKQVKGVSSAFVNEQRPEFSEKFRWQDGYACFSIGTDQTSLDRAIAYVRNQKTHHQSQELIAEWEETGEIVAEP